MKNFIEDPRIANKKIEIKAWSVKALIGFLPLLVVQVDHWGSHGMAVHPLRLINVVGALDFAKPSHNQ